MDIFMSKFEIIQGSKSEKDKILLYNGRAVAFEDVAKMCIFFMANEDNLYPPPRYKGAGMFIEYMKEVLDSRRVPTDSKYAIKKNHGVVKV